MTIYALGAETRNTTEVRLAGVKTTSEDDTATVLVLNYSTTSRVRSEAQRQRVCELLVTSESSGVTAARYERNMLTCTVPVPPSANRTWRGSRRRRLIDKTTRMVRSTVNAAISENGKARAKEH